MRNSSRRHARARRQRCRGQCFAFSQLDYSLIQDVGPGPRGSSAVPAPARILVAQNTPAAPSGRHAPPSAPSNSRSTFQTAGAAPVPEPVANRRPVAETRRTASLVLGDAQHRDSHRSLRERARDAPRPSVVRPLARPCAHLAPRCAKRSRLRARELPKAREGASRSGHRCVLVRGGFRRMEGRRRGRTLATRGVRSHAARREAAKSWNGLPNFGRP